MPPEQRGRSSSVFRRVPHEPEKRDVHRDKIPLLESLEVVAVTFQHRFGDDEDEYATPPSIWRPLAEALEGFDVDPASGAESTPIAPTRYTKEDDGLSRAWHGDVWLNPPFGDSCGTGETKRGRWLRKARNEAARDEVRSVTVLLPVDTSTGWFHEHVVEAPILCLLDKRPQFQGESVHTSFACCIAVYGDPPEELAEVLEEMGAVFRGREYHRSTVQTKLEEAVES